MKAHQTEATHAQREANGRHAARQTDARMDELREAQKDGLDAQHNSRWNFESIVIVGSGALLAIFGLSLIVAPQYSIAMTKIAQGLATDGVESGTLFVGGLVLLSIGLLARQRSQSTAVVAAQEGPEEDDEVRLITDQLLAKISQLSTTSYHVSESVARMGEVQRSFFQQSEGKDDLALEHRDALFRMASSLDKLTAHFDERFHAFDLQVRSGLEGVVTTLHQTRQHLEGRIAASELKLAKMSPGFTASDDDLHIVVDLEDPAPNLVPASDDEIDFIGTSLERLEELGAGLDDMPPGQPKP